MKTIALHSLFVQAHTYRCLRCGAFFSSALEATLTPCTAHAWTLIYPWVCTACGFNPLIGPRDVPPTYSRGCTSPQPTPPVERPPMSKPHTLVSGGRTHRCTSCGMYFLSTTEAEKPYALPCTGHRWARGTPTVCIDCGLVCSTPPFAARLSCSGSHPIPPPPREPWMSDADYERFCRYVVVQT